MNEQTFEKWVHGDDQSITYREHYLLPGPLRGIDSDAVVIQLEIKSDAYLHQCYARASLQQNGKWEQITMIPPARMHARKGLVYEPIYRADCRLAENEFHYDAQELKKTVSLILQAKGTNTPEPVQQDTTESPNVLQEFDEVTVEVLRLINGTDWSRREKGKKHKRVADVCAKVHEELLKLQSIRATLHQQHTK